MSAVLDRRRKKINGMYPVKIEVVWRSRQKYFPTGVDMPEEVWSGLDAKRRMTPEMTEIEESFNRIRNEVAEMLDNDTFSLNALAVRLGRSSGTNVNNAIRLEMDKCMKEGRINSFYRHRSTLLNIERYAGEDIPFSSVTLTTAFFSALSKSSPALISDANVAVAMFSAPSGRGLASAR